MQKQNAYINNFTISLTRTGYSALKYNYRDTKCFWLDARETGIKNSQY